MLADLNQANEAHELLKQALTTHSNSLNLRAYYTCFLIQNHLPKVAKDFVFATLKDHNRHDIYSLCAVAWILYSQARESRDPSPKGIEERKRGFQRAVEAYHKALQLDPLCAVAAQGLAIAIAEDALGVLSGVVSSPADEAQQRMKNAREALDVFAKIRESLNDGCVYVNVGHSYYARDEFDKAIESVSERSTASMYSFLIHELQYETASVRYYDSHNTSVLLYLCRSWYAKASKEQSFSAMGTALKYAQMVSLIV